MQRERKGEEQMGMRRWADGRVGMAREALGRGASEDDFWRGASLTESGGGQASYSSCQTISSPPSPRVIELGNTRSRQGRSRSTTNPGDVGESQPGTPMPPGS